MISLPQTLFVLSMSIQMVRTTTYQHTIVRPFVKTNIKPHPPNSKNKIFTEFTVLLK